MGSKAPASYVAAIAKTTAALKRHGVFLSPGESIWDIQDVGRLRELYVLVKREQLKGERGIFKEEPSASYWKRSFCSAAIKNLIDYVEFIDAYEDARESSTTAKGFESRLNEIEKGIPVEGKETVRETRVRVNQYLFRKMVLDNYRHRCCVTGLNIPEILRASHIKAWAEGKENRLDPQNGLCLSATFDAAFDRHLISLDDDLRLIFSSSLREYYTNEAFQRIFLPYEGKPIELPVKYLPSRQFLAHHRNQLA